MKAYGILNMTPQQELAQLEAQTAKTIQAAAEKKRTLEAQIKTERIKELAQAALEIQAALARYNLTIYEALDIEPQSGTYLAQVRDYYTKNP